MAKKTYYRLGQLGGFTKKDIERIRKTGERVHITGVKKYGDPTYKKVSR